MAKTQVAPQKQAQGTPAMPPGTLFDPAKKKALYSSPMFTVARQKREEHIKQSVGGGGYYPPANVPFIAAPIDWDISARTDKKDPKIVYGHSYVVALEIRDENHPGNGKVTKYYFDVPVPRDNEDPEKSKFRPGIRDLRNLMRAVTPPLDDGSDPTEDETQWLPDPKNPDVSPGILESMCEAGRAGDLLIQCTPVEELDTYQKKGPDKKPLFENGKPVMASITKHKLTKISEYTGDGATQAPPTEEAEYTEPEAEVQEEAAPRARAGRR